MNMNPQDENKKTETCLACSCPCKKHTVHTHDAAQDRPETCQSCGQAAGTCAGEPAK